MSNRIPSSSLYRSILRCLATVLLLFIVATEAAAQQMPPRPINVYVNPAQGLSFGAFYQGAAGGSVIISPNGSRSVTGGVIQVGMGFSYGPAIYEIDAEPGTLITIMNGPDAPLTGSNGGSMTLQIGSASTGSSFVSTAIPPAQTEVRIGGTLQVGSTLASPPGNYNGSFSVMFIQQ